MNLFEKEEQTAPQRLQKEMEQALTAFMKDDVGLHLFEVPTGQGKTEVATNVMAKMLLDWMEKGTPMRRIVFITPQNKQLPVDRLLSKLPKEAHPYVIQLKANVDCLNPLYPKDPAYIGKIYPDYETQINRFFGKKKSVYIKTVQDLKCYREQESILRNKSASYQRMKDMLYHNMQKQEGDLRDTLCQILREDPKVQEAMDHGTIRELFSKPKYRWIPILYPQTFIEDAKVVFLSARKLLMGMSPILEKTDTIEKLLKGSILIIDEFDSVKVDWQNHLLEEAIKRQGRDYIQLFNDTNNVLKSVQSPLVPSPLPPVISYKDSLPRDVRWAIQKAGKGSKWSQLKELGTKLNEKYYTNYAFKQDVEDQDTQIQAIINTQTYITLKKSARDGNNGKWQWLLGERDDRKNRFKLKLMDPKQLEEDDSRYVNIFTMLTEMNEFIGQFFDLIYHAGEAYAKLKNKQQEDKYKQSGNAKKDLKYITSWGATCSILHAMGFSPEYIQSVKDLIRPLNFYRKRKKDKTLYPRRSFYTRGFKIFFLKDTMKNCEKSEIQLLSVPDMPERILFNIVQRTNVIGMSATATLKTVRSNFNLDFLQDSLPENMYHEIPEETKGRMKKLMQEIYHKYNTQEINIHVTILPGEDPSKENPSLPPETICEEYAEHLNGEQELAFKLARYIDKVLNAGPLPDNRKKFCRNRYMNLATALYHFYSNEHLQSMICFEMKLPDTRKPDNGIFPENSNEFNLNVLKELNRMVLDFLKDRNYEWKTPMGLWFDKSGEKDKGIWAGSLIVLQSTDYDNQSALIERRLSKGYRLVILTSYGTATSGINITYPLPDKRKSEMKPGGQIVSLVPEPAYQKGEKRDERYRRMSVSAISLGSISYAVPLIEGDPNSQENNKHLLEKTVLVESLLYQGAISSEEGRENLKAMYQKKVNYTANKSNGDGKIRNALDVRRYYNQMLEQACGRLGRTFLKDKDIEVFINKSNLDRADMTIWNDTNPANTRTLTPIIKAIFKAAKDAISGNTLPDEAKIWQNKSQLIAGQAYHHIEGKTGLIHRMHKEHNEDAVKEYNDIRLFLLYHPVLTKEEAKACPYHELYLELPENQHGYGYKEYYNAPFQERYDLWTGRQPESSDRGGAVKPKIRFCSYETSSLPRLLKIKGVQEYLEERGIPITWPQGSCYMTPAASYIYEGMLGEIIGSFAFEDIFHVEVRTIPELEKTERFDFFIPLPKDRRIYVDIKNLADAIGGQKQGEFLEKNQQKLSEVNEETGDDKACILNIMPTDEAGVTEETNTQIHLGGQLLIISRLFDANGQLDAAAGKQLFQLLAEQGAI